MSAQQPTPTPHGRPRTPPYTGPRGARPPRSILGPVASSPEPPGPLRRWEALSVPVQAAIVFPPLAIVLFLLNVGGVGQPVARSVLYGVIEAAPVTALVLVATANERRKRTGR